MSHQYGGITGSYQSLANTPYSSSIYFQRNLYEPSIIERRPSFFNINQHNYKKILYRPAQKLIPLPSPKNVLIQWDQPNVHLRRTLVNLGVQVTDPNSYLRQFGNSLVDFNSSLINSPALIAARNVRPPNGANLAADKSHSPIHLIGNLKALELINRNN